LKVALSQVAALIKVEMPNAFIVIDAWKELKLLQAIFQAAFPAVVSLFHPAKPVPSHKWFFP